MEVIKGLGNVTRDPKSILTVGSFDGLHLGHQRIIQQMRKLEGPISVLTFNPHPQTVVKPSQNPPPLLTSFNERIALFDKIGVDRLVIAEFNKEFALMTPESFVKDLLVNTIGLSSIFVGPKHCFGRDRKGNVELLYDLGKIHNFEVNEVDPVNRFGEIISSSRIRRLLVDGDALTTWRCLGRPFYIDGVVVKGDGRGNKLGFPTANLHPQDTDKIIPPAGVYATVTEVHGIRWPSVSHFGPRPTFKGTEPTLETHIVSFRGNIYNQPVRVGLIDKLREITTFSTPAELILQLRVDIRNAAQRLAELGFGSNARLRIQRYGKILY